MNAPRKPPTAAKPTSIRQTSSAEEHRTEPLTQAKTTASPQSEASGTTQSGTDASITGLGANWDIDSVIAQIMNGGFFQSNLMNKFNNIAYHWRLFCMPDKDYAYEGDGIVTDILDLYKRLDAAPQVVIAETGVTGYNIGEVVISSVMGEVSSRGAIATDISMKINEPNGVSFLDSLQVAAREAGITNYLDFFYYLELTFKGYREDGSIDLTPFSELPNGGRWIWTVKINNIDVQLGSGGGSYKLSMIPMANHPMTAEYGTTVDTFTIKAETVGEFFDEFGTALTESWKRRMFVTRQTDGFITHKFKIHGIAGNGEAAPSAQDTAKVNLDAILDNSLEDSLSDAPIDTDLTEDQKANISATMAANGIPAATIRNMTLRPKEEDYSTVRGQKGFERTDAGTAGTNSNRDNASDEAGVPSASIPRGHLISDIVNMVMATAEPAQKLARDSSANESSADDSPERINPKGFRECVTWQVIPEVRFDKKGDDRYDFLTNRYGRTIWWHIYPRVDQEPILSHLQIAQAFGDENSSTVQKKMIAALAKRGFLPKRYDYLFTGLNTEVLNFDLGFNFAWSVNLPRFEAYYNTQKLPHALVNQTKTLLSYDEIDAVRDQAAIDLRSRVELLRAKRASGETLTQKELDELQEKTQELEQLNSQAAQAQRAGIAARAEAEARGRAALATVPNQQDYSRQFVENILDQQRKNPVAGSSIIPRIPFSWAAGDEAKQEAGLGGHGQWHLGRQLYGAVLNQVYGPTTSRFMQVDMAIRGDPFWIGQGTYEDAIDHNKEVIGDVDQRPLAYNLMGQQCFLFRFKYPADVGEDGNIMLKDNETVTGIYKVTQVKNNFSGGAFSQELHAVRMPLLDVFKSIIGTQDNADDDGSEADAQANSGGTP